LFVIFEESRVTAEEMAAPDHPVRLIVTRPAKQSRLTNFPLAIGTLIRVLLLIPHFIILYFFNLVAALVYFIASFAILFTGRYPEGLWRFYYGYLRWNQRVTGYMLHLYDPYPPFSTEEQAGYPLRVEADYPATSSRLLNFPIFGLMIKSVLLIPHFAILFFLGIASLIVISIAEFAILFTGSFPEGVHLFVVGFSGWLLRLTAYTFGVTDKYPPFSLS
jgi:hypothetical protein